MEKPASLVYQPAALGLCGRRPRTIRYSARFEPWAQWRKRLRHRCKLLTAASSGCGNPIQRQELVRDSSAFPAEILNAQDDPDWLRSGPAATTFISVGDLLRGLSGGLSLISAAL